MKKLTPHNNASKQQIANIVLMPGDPLRAKWIAETFLDNYQLVNDVRNMFAYTGYFEKTKITVMGHGMGNPSIGIYSYELFAPEFYDVKTIIRIGSCGSLDEKIKINDLFIAQSTFSESLYAQLIGLEDIKDNTLFADQKIVDLATKKAKELNINFHLGQAYASDVFYAKRSVAETIKITKSQVVEMEAFALYSNAKLFNKQALCLLTVSDSLITHESLDAKDRQTKFVNMVKLALNLAKDLA